MSNIFGQEGHIHFAKIITEHISFHLVNFLKFLISVGFFIALTFCTIEIKTNKQI